jgi:hypothetical protein
VDAFPDVCEALNRLVIEAGEGDHRGRAIDLLRPEIMTRANAALEKARGK